MPDLLKNYWHIVSGAAMLILHYWPVLSGISLVVQILRCLGKFAVYIACCLVVLLPIRFLTKVPPFIFRKLLHIVAFSCITVMIMTAESWMAASSASVIIAAMLYPALSILENEPWYGQLFVQKSKGEIKRSLLMLFLMFAVVTAVSWGIFGKLHACATAILMWGFGDAAAALVGIPFGKHKIVSRLTDGRKSYEGTLSMFLVSFTTGFCFLMYFGTMSLGMTALASLISAVVAAAAELFSGSEYDTVTVPLAVLAVLLLF